VHRRGIVGEQAVGHQGVDMAITIFADNRGFRSELATRTDRGVDDPATGMKFWHQEKYCFQNSFEKRPDYDSDSGEAQQSERGWHFLFERKNFNRGVSASGYEEKRAKRNQQQSPDQSSVHAVPPQICNSVKIQ
jgi:hypothetical protein